MKVIMTLISTTTVCLHYLLEKDLVAYVIQLLFIAYSFVESKLGEIGLSFSFCLRSH